MRLKPTRRAAPPCPVLPTRCSLITAARERGTQRVSVSVRARSYKGGGVVSASIHHSPCESHSVSTESLQPVSVWGVYLVRFHRIKELSMQG